MKRSYFIFFSIVTVLLALYVGSYTVLSRRGYAEAKQYDFSGFYYLRPENTASWSRWNMLLRYLYMPLNELDCAIGTGMYPAADPLFEISP